MATRTTPATPTGETSTTGIAAADIETFKREGVILLNGIFADWVDTLRDGIERNMADPSPLERTYRPQDGSAPFFQDYRSWQRIPQYRAFVEGSSMARPPPRNSCAPTPPACSTNTCW